MQFTTLLTITLASVAMATPDFAIGTKQYTFSAADKSKVTKAVMEAASSFHASVTAQPEYSSAWSELAEFQKTHSGVPEGVTATDSVIEFASTPTWYVFLNKPL
jgi:hypothetical protein